MNWVENDRCEQCGREGSEHQRPYACIVLKKIRLVIQREVGSHQQQASTCKDEIV